MGNMYVPDPPKHDSGLVHVVLFSNALHVLGVQGCRKLNCHGTSSSWRGIVV